MCRIYDLSPPISPRLKVWPGDTPPSREVLSDMKRGDGLTLSTLHATVHLGSHVDGPNHYGLDAPGVDSLPLDTFVGPCQVIRPRVVQGEAVGSGHLPDGALPPRVLIDTGTHPDPEAFPEVFAPLDPALIDTLADRGVVLVGTDAPSVDRFDSKDLPTHWRCLERGVTILEGVCLGGVPEGDYELIALPLRLVGFDASPVRAVLRTLPRG
ncbi:cyclase family protein [Tautonia plasticadhaerens]|uniref:Kynurenine formamidase n=1 Tax=Tautonia plasticadhaerens TaxID=2527974 RepID=A0A518H7P6_9BACT|nr:cyclase family protein [Tautonia plasticadhaerens]QDV36863.1 Kynurenine formamidase [Tautonia plasticadhaerens]